MGRPSGGGEGGEGENDNSDSSTEVISFIGTLNIILKAEELKELDELEDRREEEYEDFESDSDGSSVTKIYSGDDGWCSRRDGHSVGVSLDGDLSSRYKKRSRNDRKVYIVISILSSLVIAAGIVVYFQLQTQENLQKAIARSEEHQNLTCGKQCFANNKYITLKCELRGIHVGLESVTCSVNACNGTCADDWTISMPTCSELVRLCRSAHCFTIPCPKSGYLTIWSLWSSCSRTCGIGSRFRQRFGRKKQSKMCTSKERCPIDGGLSKWLPWSKCLKTCGVETRVRIRKCDNPSPKYGGLNCKGSDSVLERKKCSIPKICVR